MTSCNILCTSDINCFVIKAFLCTILGVIFILALSLSQQSYIETESSKHSKLKHIDRIHAFIQSQCKHPTLHHLF